MPIIMRTLSDEDILDWAESFTATEENGENEMDYKTLIADVHKNALDKGFHKDRDNIPEKVMLIICEVGEAIEAHRSGKIIPAEFYHIYEKQKGKNKNIYFETRIKDSFQDEIADIYIRIFDLCGYLGIEEIHMGEISCDFTDNVAENLFIITSWIIGIPSSYPYHHNIFTAIGLLSGFCKHHNIDIQRHIKMKMEYNLTRPRLHGKGY